MNKKPNCSHKRCFKVAFIVASILLYSVLICSLILLEKSSKLNKTTNKSKLDAFKLVNWIYPLSFSAKLVYVWQGLWLIYAFLYTFRRLPNGVLFLNQFDLLHNGIFLSFSATAISLVVWLLCKHNNMLDYSLIALIIGLVTLCVSIYIAFNTMYKYTDDLNANYQSIKIDIWLMRLLVHNGIAALAAHLTLCLLLNLTSHLAMALKLDTTITTRIMLASISLLMISYSHTENFILQKYFLYIFSPWLLATYDLVSNLVLNLNVSSSSPSYKDLTTNQNMNILVAFGSVLLLALKLIMFVLYNTTRKHQLDKSQSHKILQHKQDKLLAFLKKAQEERFNQFENIQYCKI